MAADDEVDKLLEEIHGELQLEFHTGDRPIPVPWSTIQDKRAFDRLQGLQATTATDINPSPTTTAQQPQQSQQYGHHLPHGVVAPPLHGIAADDDLWQRLERLKAPPPPPIASSSKDEGHDDVRRPSDATLPTSSNMDDLLALLIATPPSAPLSHEQQVERLLREAHAQVQQDDDTADQR